MSKSADKAFLGHPVGLAVLFFTEMWERFSYYGMRAILILFIISPVESGGLGWSNIEALALYGWYTMLVYVMGIPGGIIADRWLGQKKNCNDWRIVALFGAWSSCYSGYNCFLCRIGFNYNGSWRLKA